MIKSIVKLGLILLVGVIAYNYFLGDAEEKEKARDIVGKTVDIGKAGVGLLKEEYQKFKDGKYDKALDKVGDLLKDAKQKGGAIVEDIKEWENDRQLWQEKKEELMEFIENNPDDITEKQQEQLKKLEKEGNEL
ncbi:MAG: hypothetical protein ACI81W_004153, partial [Saprospiraceae bacterium]